MSIAVFCYVVAFALSGFTVISSNGKSAIGWACLALATGLLLPFFGG